MKVIISGISGRMGQELLAEIARADGISAVCGFDAQDGEAPLPGGGTVPVFSAARLGEAPAADAVIDFSHFSFAPSLIGWCARTGTPLVLATTALDEAALSLADEAAKTIPVFRSANMSLGIGVMAKAARAMTPVLEDDFFVEIVEKHHKEKQDAPSGTALLLADAVNSGAARKKEYIYGRHGRADAPSIGELGIHAVRGGTLPGQHTLMYLGPDETIEITHTVYSRRVFAVGALKAARFVATQPPGLYSMDDMM